MKKRLIEKYDALKQKLPQTKYDYAGKTVLITGGGQGIGRCLSLSYAINGAKVIVFDINNDAGQETVELGKYLISDYGSDGKMIFAAADLSVCEEINSAVDKVRPELDSNGLYVLINNAAIADAHSAHLRSNEPAAFDKVLSVNLRAPFLLSSKLEFWLKRAGGSIINIASTRAFMSEAESEGYSASKGGIVSLTHAMAMTMADSHIRVNSVSPGWIATQEWQAGFPPAEVFSDQDHSQHPVGRVGTPADIAAACMYLSSKDAGFITGINLTVDGGMTHKMIYK